MDMSYSGAEEHLAGEGFQPQAIYRDGWVWGLGANNMKSGLAAALSAIEAIAAAGIELPGDISFAGVVGEIEKTAVEEFQGVEYSGYGIGTRHLVTHGVTADFALLAEPTGLNIAIANMGVIWLRITVHGTVAHSALANRPNVVNAIAVMHELQSDIAQWARDYEAKHEYMSERANVTIAAIRGGAPWRLSRRTIAVSTSTFARCLARASRTSSATCAAFSAPSASAKVFRSRRCTSMSPIRRWCSTAN
jgi:acetylornithine deacetylase